VRQFNGRLSQSPRCCIFLFVRICRSYRHCSSYMVCLELLFLHQRLGFEFSVAPEPPCLIQIWFYVSISFAPDTRIAKGFGIFSESTMLNHLQSIAKENLYQLLDLPETDPVQYVSNHARIERQSRWYRVDASYHETWLAYSRLTWRLQPSISSVSNDIHVHPRFDTAHILKSMANFE